MELDRGTIAVLDDSTEKHIGEWRIAENGSLVPQRDQPEGAAPLPHILRLATALLSGREPDSWVRSANQEPPLQEVEQHIRAVRELESWLETVPEFSKGQAPRVMDTLSGSLDGFPFTGLDGLPGDPQGRSLREIIALLLQLLAEQVALALDNTDLLEATYRMAITDGLTGLSNRRHFDERLTQEVHRAVRYERPFSVIILDIDHFKHHNDRLGHLEADRILVQLARLLRESVRRGDMVARYGGDEFVILLPETDIEAGRVVADRVRRAVEQKVFAYSRVTISAGVVTWRLGERSPAEVLTAADRALYRAKGMGGNCVWAPDVATEGQCAAQVPTAGGSG